MIRAPDLTLWRHNLCIECWKELNPLRTPARILNADLERCCSCQELNTDGIYYHADGQTLPGRGRHGERK